MFVWMTVNTCMCSHAHGLELQRKRGVEAVLGELRQEDCDFKASLSYRIDHHKKRI